MDPFLVVTKNKPRKLLKWKVDIVKMYQMLDGPLPVLRAMLAVFPLGEVGGRTARKMIREDMIEPLVFGLVATWTRQSRPENIAALIESDPLLLRIPNSQGNLLLHALVKGRDNDSRRVAPYIIAHVAAQDPNALRVKNRSGFLPIHLAKESIN